MMGGAISWVRGAQLAGNVVEAPGEDPSLKKSSCPTSSQPPPPRKLADGEFATHIGSEGILASLPTARQADLDALNVSTKAQLYLHNYFFNAVTGTETKTK